MSEFFKSKGKFGLSLGAVFLAITLALSAFAYSGQGLAMMSGSIVDDGPSQEELAVQSVEAEQLEYAYEPEAEPEPVQEQVIQHRAPGEMRGAYLTPGVDFLATSDTSETALRAEISEAIQNARKLEINTLIINTAYEDSVIYQTKDAPELSSSFDVFEYVVGEARKEDLYVYAIFDASMYQSRSSMLSLMAIGAGTINRLSTNLTEFCQKYELDGILLDGYTADSDDESGSYAAYLSGGGGIGFDNYKRQSPSAVVKSASDTIRSVSPDTMVGLLTDAVWENQSANEEGSATEASYTSLTDGNADTKGFIEKGYVDFVAVKAYSTTDSATEPFQEVVTWWADLAMRHDLPLYVVHATDKLFTDESGWGSADQIIRQIDAVQGVSGVRGSIFNNLQKVSTDDQNLASNIKKLYNHEVDAAQILTRLEMTSPAQTTYTTGDPQVVFRGASDPGEPVTIDEVEIQRDSTGYFAVEKPLTTGENTFTIEHKDKTVTYNITRKVELLREISPKDNITVEGGMTITITALAYEDANVYATFGGSTISMTVDSSVENEESRDGYFRTFRGEIKAPAATGEEQNLGKIVVYAEAEGESASLEGGSVKVNKKAKLEDGVAVRITADQAMTYPADTLDNVPDPGYYPLPAGAMDYAVGDEIFYQKTENGKTKSYSYFVLASGLRVESGDIAAISDDYASGNSISGLTVSTGDGYTYVTLNTAQKVTYSVDYTASAISFQFHNTTSVPESISLSKNPLFTAANWSGTTLTLNLAKQGAFMGYKGYYDSDGNLVLRFNNSPGSLSGARIAIDPGHGGGDKGASGFLADYPESVINSQIAQYVADELQSRGATVNLMNNAGIEGDQRRKEAEKWNADLFVSIHANSAPNINAAGTEVYYFRPYAQTLASSASSNVSASLSTNNRGAKQSYYYVTLSSEMPSVLVETGFLTNKNEYEKLITTAYQQKIASGIADALSSTIGAMSTGLSASGTEGTSGAKSTTSTDQTGSGSGAGDVEGLSLDTTATVTVGGAKTLTPTFQPADSRESLTWKSSDESVATVDGDGKVTGVRTGTATITATGKDSGSEASCSVTVKESGDSVSSISLSEELVDIAVGQSYTLRPTILPTNADDVGLTWRSSDTKVATVSSSGVVTALSEGIATVSVITDDGKQTSCTIYAVGAGSTNNTPLASSGVPLSGVTSITAAYSDYTVNPNSSVKMEVLSQRSEQIRGSDFTWRSDDTAVATVDRDGNVTGKRTGTARITATGKGHGSVDFIVKVTNSTIGISSITLDQTVFSLERGRTHQLKATVTPSGASAANVVWSSENSKVASVTQNGLVTALSPGAAVIVARSKSDSSVVAKSTVNVYNMTDSRSAAPVGVIEGFYILYGGDNDVRVIDSRVGESGRLQYEYYPLSATATGVNWYSQNASVVTIDQNGNFKCLQKGTATIILSSSSYANAKKTIEIRVV